jgi:long-chain acyl-CoA synthetase
MIFEHAAKNPNGLALDDLTRQRTWTELADRSARVAHFLRDQAGLGPDEHVAVLMDNRVELIELILGAILAGIWITPINWHLHPEEIAYIIEDSGALLLFSDMRFADTARRSGASDVLLAGAELDGALAEASARPIELDARPGGAMIYTSGTTGRPKGVKRARAPTLGATLTTVRSASRNMGLDGSGAHLITGPMYHAAPLLFALYDHLSGAPLVIMPKWDASQALELIQEREIAHTHMVPTMFVHLLRAARSPGEFRRTPARARAPRCRTGRGPDQAANDRVVGREARRVLGRQRSRASHSCRLRRLARPSGNRGPSHPRLRDLCRR